MTKDDNQILEELYVNSKIKQAIKKLVKEGKSKNEIEKILYEAGFLNNLVQGAKNAYQNYWQDPRAIKAGGNAGFDVRGLETRAKGQTAYNRQTIRKFQKEIAGTIKNLQKISNKSTATYNQTVFKTVDNLFKMIKEEGPNVDPSFLISQFQSIYDALNNAMNTSTAAIQKNYNNLMNQIKSMGASMMGGMRQQDPQPQQQQPPQAPPPAAGTPRQGLAGSYNNQNVAGQFATPNAQVNASTEVKLYKKDHVLMESAYEQVLNKKK